MKTGQIWSEEFDCYVSQTFMPRQDKNIKLDITKCIIKISEFGFYELWLNSKKLKDISFLEYLSYRKYVNNKLIELYAIRELIEDREKYDEYSKSLQNDS